MTTKSLVGIVAILATAALLTPKVADARSGKHQDHATLVLKLVPPLVFSDATATCPDGALSFALNSTAGAGTGSACFLSATTTTPCATAVCQVIASTIRFALCGGTMTINAHQFETDSFDSTSGTLAITARFEGTVTYGTHRFHKLAGAPVRGGGVTAFAADGTITTTVTFLIAEDDND